MNLEIAEEPALAVAEFRAVLQASGLASRRPMDDDLRLAAMLNSADIVLVARVDGRAVGVARALTDFSYCTYLSDLAVAANLQRRGIGRQLLRRVHTVAGRHTTLILLAAPAARDYYRHIGLTRHESCWTVPAETPRPE